MTRLSSCISCWQHNEKVWITLAAENAIFYGRKKLLGITDKDMTESPDVCIDVMYQAACYLGNVQAVSRA